LKLTNGSASFLRLALIQWDTLSEL
jgi:hypothetical protein